MWSLFGRNKNDRGTAQELDSQQNSAETQAVDVDEQVTEVYDTAVQQFAKQETVADTGEQQQTEFATDVDNAQAPAENKSRERALSAQSAVAADKRDKSLQTNSFKRKPAETKPAARGEQPAAEQKNIQPKIDFAKIHTSWRTVASELGGPDPLLHFDDSELGRIDLSATHPSGLAQFITGQKTLLSSLVRDEVALRRARLAAGRVTDKATEMRNMRGLETVHLGVGVAKWSYEGEDFCAPVLLRPLAIRRYGRDFEIKLKRGAQVNPQLVSALRAQFGIVIDGPTLVELSQSEGVFKPQPVIDRLRQIAAGIPNFTVQPRLVASSFSGVAHRIVNDLRSGLDTPVLRAISGDEAAAAKMRRDYKPVNPIPLNKRAPETDRCLYDADAQQDDVIAQVAAGQSVLVHTLPGTGGTQTVVNALGELVRGGKRVLVVSPRHATIEGIAHRLSRVGLAGLMATPRKLRRSLVEAIRRNEQSSHGNSRDIDQALVRLRDVLVEYRDALDAADERLAVTPMQALRELAKLSLMNEPPQTTVRLSEAALMSLAMERGAVADELTEVARLGQFQYGPDDSPWYGVKFSTTEQARKAYGRAVDLSETKLPRLTGLASELLEQCSLRPYENIYELGIYLRLLEGIGKTLDRFTPEVYDRSLTEVIAAHAPRSNNDTMSNTNRRRLKKLAREYVRPGVTVNDMYARLVEIQQQRVLWQRYCTVPGTRPELPVGLADVVGIYQSVFDDIEELDTVLSVEADAARMRNLPLPTLQRRLAALAEPSEVLQNIQERTAIIERLRDADLGGLLDDLSARHVPAGLVAAELEQAWWQTALEHMLSVNTALLSANTGIVERLEADFRLVDDAHAGGNGQRLAAELADIWRVAVIDNRAEASVLRDSLRAGVNDPGELLQAAPTLLHALSPVWAMSPYEVSLLPADMHFDTVILVDAAAISVVEAAGALKRARQVVAFGDPVIQTPSAFNIAVLESEYAGETPVLPGSNTPGVESAYAALAKILPRLELTRSYRAGGADLTDLVNTKFYRGAIETMPWAGTFLNRSSLTQEFVRSGQGLPDSVTGAVESPDAEVERVVQLVLKHAQEHPNESLMVVTASRKHAVRVWQSVLKVFAKAPEHREFLLGEHAEPFTVVTIEQASALSRDRVIFSIGFGRTPHGRVLSNFGPLSQPGGERLIAVAMTRARRAMTIVSCFSAEHLDTIKALHGVKQLAAVIGAETAEPIADVLPAEQDAMVAELAERLRALGLKVAQNYQGMIPIAASFGDKAIAIDIDFSGEDDSMRHTLRLRPAVLRRLGWHYQRVQSFDLFQDPQAVALRVAGIIGYDPDATAAYDFVDEGQTGATELVSVADDSESAVAINADNNQSEFRNSERSQATDAELRIDTAESEAEKHPADSRKSRRVRRESAVPSEVSGDSDESIFEVAAEDKPQSWGDVPDDNNERLLNDKPPHWQ